MIKKYLKDLFYIFMLNLLQRVNDYKMQLLKHEHGFSDTVRLDDCTIVGKVHIDNYTYVNKGSTISSGPTCSVEIGKHCAIGRYVHITAKGHSLVMPTSSESYMTHQHVEKNTAIGDYVWIGDHVFIKHGITIGDYAIIGANSVVTKDVEPFEIVGGVPARHIRFNTEHYRYTKHHSD